jgi:hypothetical protein
MISAAPLRSAPAPALALGVAGLVPFAALTALAHFQPEPWYAVWLTSLAQYGALILAFVGALQWGYAAQSNLQGAQGWIRYGWSVMPALVGWASLQFPVWTALRMQAAALFITLAMDRRFARAHGAPPWLMPLRYSLTAAGASCLLAASYA